MSYSTLDELIARLNSVYTNRGALDVLLTVGTSQFTTIAVWKRNEPYSIKAPLNLKWLKGNVMYVRVSRSPSGGLRNSWVPIQTLSKALEAEKWDQIKPANWDLLQHTTNIDDPHSSRVEFQGGELTSPLKLYVNQPIGPDYAASQRYVDSAVQNSQRRFEYSSPAPATEHNINHKLGLAIPEVSVYVGGARVLTDVVIVDRNNITVRFPYAESCGVVIS